MRGEEKEKFLSRWSRRKQEAREPSEDAPAAAPAVDPQAPPPELPPVEKLSIDSDFRGFFHPKVDEKLRRTALKRLFSDPHFNVMDGLDVYIEDYSIPSPMPAAMLASLKQAQNILEWAKEKKDEGPTGDGEPHAAAGEAETRQLDDQREPPGADGAAPAVVTRTAAPDDVVAPSPSASGQSDRARREDT